MTAQAETYRLHLACLSSIRGGLCATCNRQVGDDEVATREAEYGWRHTPCGRLVVDRDGRPWCEGRECNYFVDPAELTINDPLAG
jgi:hypothetical protein